MLFYENSAENWKLFPRACPGNHYIPDYFRAKAKNGNHALRTQLEERDITIPTGRRKAASVSLFTSLLEGEWEFYDVVAVVTSS